MDRWIQHVDEPERLILAWEAPDPDGDRRRWAVGELTRVGDGAHFRYLQDESFAALNHGRSLADIRKAGFLGYPAFDASASYSGLFTEGVLEAFLRRLPPRTRSDFPRYLEHFRLKSAATLGPFALLGITEAKLPSDGFSLIDPLESSSLFRDVVFEIAGHHYYKVPGDGLAVGQALSLVADPENAHDDQAVRIEADGALIGFMNRLQAPTMRRWLEQRDVSAWLLRMNGTPAKPRAFVFVRVRPNERRQAA